MNRVGCRQSTKADRVLRLTNARSRRSRCWQPPDAAQGTSALRTAGAIWPAGWPRPARCWTMRRRGRRRGRQLRRRPAVGDQELCRWVSGGAPTSESSLASASGFWSTVYGVSRSGAARRSGWLRPPGIPNECGGGGPRERVTLLPGAGCGSVPTTAAADLFAVGDAVREASSPTPWPRRPRPPAVVQAQAE